MSGHSKWSTIKREKGAADAKRSKMFSRISKEITVAVREGGTDSETNPRLRAAINNAKGVNMPKENIQRAINKADKDGEVLLDLTFEGYGPEGAPIFIECLTDNNNRTVSSIRSIFTKRGGSLGTNGSLSFLFERKGVFVIPKGDFNQEEIELDLIDGGAEEIEISDEFIEVYTQMADFGKMQKKLEELGLEASEANLQRIPNDYKVLDTQAALKVLRVIDAFEDNDDVQNVYHNIEMTDELMEALENEE